MFVKCRALMIAPIFAAAFGSSLAALPATPWERAEVFATCAGRFAALHESHRSQNAAMADRSAEMRDTFLALLEATRDDALESGVPQVQIASWRSGGWREVAVLLAEERLNFNETTAARAGAAASERVEICRELVFGPAPQSVGF